MKNYNCIFLLILLFNSCNNNVERIKKIIVNDKNEYWYCTTDNETSGTNFKFNKNGTYDKYIKYIDSGYVLFNEDGDIFPEEQVWSIKNDSVLHFNGYDYIIESYNKDKIVISSFDKHKKKFKMYFTKRIDN